MKIYSKKKKTDYEEMTDYWKSYSDMMAALLLIFILIMGATLYMALNSYEKKNETLQNREEIISELESTKAQLEELSGMVGVKYEIIEALNKEFVDSKLSVLIDEQTGAITFDSSILFAYDDYSISSEGAEFLSKFIPKYISVLLNDQFKEYISEIIIEGHTDTNGSYMYNLNLSQQRAFSVASYCLDEQKKILDIDSINSLRNILTANGRSYSDPVYKNEQIDMNASRRVVFKFRLKDDEMIESMRKILVNDND